MEKRYDMILELKPEVEAAAEDAEAIRQRRMEILSRLQGKHAGLPGGSEEFATQKAEEKAREEYPLYGHLP